MFNYHFRVKMLSCILKPTTQGLQQHLLDLVGLHDRNSVMAALEFVRDLKEIVELDYGTFRQTVLIGLWVKANYWGEAATVKRDKWGFTIANFNRMVDFEPDAFVSPLQVQ